MTLQTLNNLADWHADRACAAWAFADKEKNYDRSHDALRDFARHTHYADQYRRKAFLLSHRRKA